MITVAEAQELVIRLAASNILLRRLDLNDMSDADRAYLDRVLVANTNALHDFAAAHPETIGDAGDMFV